MLAGLGGRFRSRSREKDLSSTSFIGRHLNRAAREERSLTAFAGGGAPSEGREREGNAEGWELLKCWDV